MAINAIKDRYNYDGKLISDKAFYTVIAATLFLGFAINAVIVTFCYEYIIAFAAEHILLFYFGTIISMIVGVIINVVSRKPVVSFIGYLLVVLPIGALLACTLPFVAYQVVRSAFIATACVTIAMMLLAVLYPRIFYTMYQVVSVCLLIALIYQIIAMFTGFGLGNIWDWLVVCLFCCYIGFDVSLAKNRPRTLDNAIDSACGLYLDIINIFVRLLAILSRNSR
jgi:FtsH-binding integral membrane protein